MIMATRDLPNWMTHDEADGSYTVTLKRPTKVAGTLRTDIKLREPTLLDQEVWAAYTGSDALKQRKMLAGLAGLAPDDMKTLSVADGLRLAEAFQRFLDLDDRESATES